MFRSLLLLAGALAGCASSPDDRPATFEFVSLAVLSPSCGTVACHSTTTQIEGYAFDTLAGARRALNRLVTRGNANGSRLIRITRSNEMPPDAPMADEDIALVATWIDGGAQGL